MPCNRCGGWMTPDQFTDLLNSSELLFDGWRCVNCGEVVDRLVLQNRENPELACAVTKRRWPRVLAA